MNKICGNQSDFAFIRDEESRIVIGYGLLAVNNTDLYEWYEVYIPKNQCNQLNIEVVKDAILGDINARTDGKILNGYEFTPDGAENPIVVWLSKESQTDFSEAQRLQIVPVKFKLNEDENKQPIYHTFETVEELNRFYIGGVQYIQQCLQEGWAEKDSIDWQPYEEVLEQMEAERQAAEEAARQAAEEEAARLAEEEAETEQEPQSEPQAAEEP